MLLKKLFASMPVFVRDIAVTCVGFKHYVSRFAGVASELEPIFGKPDRKVTLEQERRLREVLAHALTSVPYYRSLNIDYDDFQFKPIKEILHKFPIITKEIVAESPHSFYSINAGQKSGSLYTSGTSGTPLEIKYTNISRKENYSFYNMLLSLGGCSYRDRSVTFAGRDFVSESENKVFWVADYFSNTLYMSSYHISRTNIPLYLRQLAKWKPRFIDAYPSAILQFAEYILQNDIDVGFRTKLIFTSSETLTTESRKKIESAFGAPVLDQYGCTEMCTMAYSFKSADYFFDPRYSYVELINTEVDSEKEIVCTGLLNEAMPLIRYRIGDLVETDDSLPFEEYYSVKSIVGRVDDVIKLEDGRVIGRMDPVYKGINGLARAQIIQEDIGSLMIMCEEVRKGSFGYDNQHKLISNIRSRLGAEIKVGIKIVDQIPLSKSGKFRAVISKI